MRVDVTRGATADLEAYEEIVLASLGIAATDAPLERWSRVYAAISDSLADGTARGPTGLSKMPFPADEVSAVWGLVYGARTYEAASRIFSTYPPPVAPLVELGAGWGSGALAAVQGLQVATTTLVDLAMDRLEWARRLFAQAQAPEPRVRVEDARSAKIPRGTGSVCLSYSFGEMMGERRPEAGAEMVRAWMGQLDEAGRLYILEPGSFVSARRLQAVRDALDPSLSVLAPCTGAKSCPLLASSSEWCHFTWPFRPGPVTRALMDASGRRWQELHLSWLVVERGAQATPRCANRVRILERKPAGRGKLLLKGCSTSGLVSLTALTRSEDLRTKLGECASGSLVELEIDRLQAKGDGLRIESEDQFRYVRDL